jgi:hypothetical protein
MGHILLADCKLYDKKKTKAEMESGGKMLNKTFTPLLDDISCGTFWHYWLIEEINDVYRGGPQNQSANQHSAMLELIKPTNK